MYEKLEDGSIYAELDGGLVIVEPDGLSTLVPTHADADPIDIPRDEAVRCWRPRGSS